MSLYTLLKNITTVHFGLVIGLVDCVDTAVCFHSQKEFKLLLIYLQIDSYTADFTANCFQNMTVQTTSSYSGPVHWYTNKN